ncbi:MAG TPA: LysR family transcriptional regulator [Beijerinckiaceae bacterium]|nr:LysR family transcriptional regulator [Beijerinckiaceae bacterium]
MQTIEWDDFRLVKVIAEHRSLGPAAEALKLNHSTVFRKLNALEEQLGTRLFERSRNGYSLTASGEEMLVIAGQMADAVFDFERRLAGMDARPTGTLRVTTTESMLENLLAPIFTSFRLLYPGIHLEVLVDARPLNLSRRDADVAIRAAMEPTDTLVGRRIASMAWAAYAHKDKMPPGPVNLFNDDLSWIGFGDPVSLSVAGRWFANHIPHHRMAMTVNAVSSMARLAQAGAGVAMLPCFVGDRQDSLRRIAEPVKDATSTLWLLTHSDLKNAVRIRAFLDFVGAELIRQRRLIEGLEPQPA